MHDIFDIACNFTSERFEGDLEEIINRAIKNIDLCIINNISYLYN